MKISFKTVLACVCVANIMNGFSQKEQYFRPSINGGISTINYSTDEISPKLFDPTSLGGGTTAEYIMFFNQYVGASAGIGVSMSQSKYELSGILNSTMSYFSFETNTTKDFVYSAQFDKWEEKQMIHTVDIPVGAVGKYSFSDKITAMAGLGVKFQLPIKSTYKVSTGGTRTSTGYFNEANVVLKDIPHQGFYTLESGQEGDLNTKSIAFAAYLDLGVMQKIGSQRVYYGIYGQYGFTQINAVAENPFLTQFGKYDSPLNTTDIEKSRLISFGIKLGYVLPVKGVADEASTEEETTDESVVEESAEEVSVEEAPVEVPSAEEVSTEEDNKASSLKPEREDRPYTTANVETNQSLVSTNESAVADSSNNNESVKKQSIFKHIAGKFKKKDKTK